MTTTTQPVPVGQNTKEGPNKVLLIILGILCAGALFMFVIKPMLLDSKPKSSGGSTATTTQAPSQSGSGTTATTAAGQATTAPGAGSGTSTPATESGDPSAPGVSSTPVQSDSLPQIPAQYAGQTARDPFKPLVQESGGATTAK